MSLEVITARQAWGLAVHAYRKNNNQYISARTIDSNDITNKDIIYAEVCNNLVNLTQEDLDQGEVIQNWVHSKLTMAALTRPLKEFERTLNDIVVKQEFKNKRGYVQHISYVASQIGSYFDELAEQELTSNIENTIELTREPLAELKQRLDIKATVTNVKYSRFYDTYFVTAITSTGHSVRFGTKVKLIQGRDIVAKGTVKDYNNGVTQLNRVKIQQASI